MEKNERYNQEYYTIDLKHIFKSVWRKVWLVILAGVIAASIGFSYSAFVIAPKYSSSILLYVNNSSLSLGSTNFSISSSEISAAQSLVKTYIVMLQNRTTLESVIEKADVDYTYKELDAMISASAVNDTEVMQVTVTAKDPYEAAKIVNSIAKVLPMRISEIIDGASMEVVDDGVPNLQKISPSITKYTAVGMILGIVLSIITIAIIALFDDTIHDEDYILDNYGYPILAKIPNLLNADSKQNYSAYYKRPRNSGAR